MKIFVTAKEEMRHDSYGLVHCRNGVTKCKQAENRRPSVCKGNAISVDA